eukprot:3517276-Prymnesium_polylepis.1
MRVSVHNSVRRFRENRRARLLTLRSIGMTSLAGSHHIFTRVHVRFTPDSRQIPMAPRAAP